MSLERSPHDVPSTEPLNRRGCFIEPDPSNVVGTPASLDDCGSFPSRDHPLLVLAAVLVVRTPVALDSLCGHLPDVLFSELAHLFRLRPACECLVTVLGAIGKPSSSNDSSGACGPLHLAIGSEVVRWHVDIGHRMSSSVRVDDVTQWCRGKFASLRVCEHQGAAAHPRRCLKLFMWFGTSAEPFLGRIAGHPLFSLLSDTTYRHGGAASLLLL
mmetsp:Transcript_78539/g.163179  ORF Transcript_78539/g.163179 Transcript_78539/m.163179 type:complete len:214 (-) Transcript_78539:872-1513(-)